MYMQTQIIIWHTKKGQFSLLSSIVNAPFVMKIVYRMKSNTYSKPLKEWL
jgi:hypothetical protein